MLVSKPAADDIRRLCAMLEDSCEELIREQEARIAAECPGLLHVIESETPGWPAEKTASLMAAIAITPLPRRPMVAWPSAGEAETDREGRYMSMDLAIDVSRISLYLFGAPGCENDALDVLRAHARVHMAIRSARR